MLHDLNKPPSDPALRDAWVAFRDKYYEDLDKKNSLIIPAYPTYTKAVATTFAEAIRKPNRQTLEDRKKIKAERTVERNERRIEEFHTAIVCPALQEDEYQAPCCKLIRMICSKTGRVTTERKCIKCQKKNA